MNISKRNPSNFFDSVTEIIQKEGRDAKESYEKKILLTGLGGLYNISKSIIYDTYNSSNRPLEELKDDSEYMEFKSIYIEKLKQQTLEKLVTRFKKQKACERFVELSKINKSALIGLVFPVLGRGDWILHSFGADYEEPGKARIYIPGSSLEIHALRLCPVKLFISERKIDIERNGHV